MTPLPITHLPQLVLIKIINQMNPAEQFLLSLCSRRAHAYVKKYRNPKQILTLSQYARGGLSVYHKQEMGYRPMEYSHCHMTKSQMVDSSHENRIHFEIENYRLCDSLSTYWKDPKVGKQIFLELLIDLFPINVNTLCIYHPSCIWVLEWFKNHQKTVYQYSVFLDKSDFKAEDLDYVLLNCEAEKLEIIGSGSFPYEIKNFHKKFGAFYACRGGNWLTISNLMTLDCIEIDVSKRFACSEVNLFLKNWLSGGTPNLKYLVIGVKNYSMDETFAGIRNHLIWVPGSRVYTSPYKSTFKFDGLQLHRNDGVIASIQCTEEKIHIGIWPDKNGSN